MSVPTASSRPHQAGSVARRWVGGLAVLATAAVLISGCTSASGAGVSSPNSTSSPASTSTSTSAAVPSPADPNAGLKTGTQLKTALLTKKDLPGGYKISADLVRDTADGFGPPSVPVKPTKSACEKLITNAWVEGAGIGAATFAQTGFTDPFGDEIDAEIDAFRGADANQVMTNFRKLFKLCSTFSTKAPGIGRLTVKLVSAPDPKIGDDSVKATLTSSAWQGGQTLAAVQLGKTVITVLFSSSKNDLGAKAVNYAETMAGRLG